MLENSFCEVWNNSVNVKLNETGHPANIHHVIDMKFLELTL